MMLYVLIPVDYNYDYEALVVLLFDERSTQ
jgi:hypothetical protein